MSESKDTKLFGKSKGFNEIFKTILTDNLLSARADILRIIIGVRRALSALR